MAFFGAPDIRALQEKAQAAAVRGKFKDAVELNRQVLKQAPHDLATRQKVAELLARMGRLPEAIQEYQHVAGGYAVDGFLLKAMAVCKVILQLDATHTETQATLARLYAQKAGPDAKQRLPASMSAAVDPNARRVAFPPLPPTPLSSLGSMGSLPPPVPEDDDGTSAEIELEDSGEILLDTSTVPRIPLFSDLAPAEFVALLEQLNMRAAHPGEVLVREGETGNSMFVVVQGQVSVARNGVDGKPVRLAEMGDGAFFGEMALLTNAPRLASVTVESEAIILELTRERVQDLIKRYPSVGNVLDAFHRDRLLQNLMRSSPIFRALSEGDRKGLVSQFKSVAVPADMELLRQGQDGDGLYLLLRGTCEASTRAPNGTIQTHPTMHEGDVFGEISMVYGTPVTATVKTSSPCVLLCLPVDVFNKSIRPHPEVIGLMGKLGSERLERTVLAVPLDASYPTGA